MTDFARATAAPRSFALGGEIYLVGQLTPRGLGDLQQWLSECVEDPRVKTRALMDGLPDPVQQAMWLRAALDARDRVPAIGSRESLIHLLSVEGQARLLWVALRDHNPVDLREARRLAATHELDEAQAVELLDLMAAYRLGDPLDPDGDGGGIPYETMRYQLATGLFCLPTEIDNLPIGLIRDLGSEGKPSAGVPVSSEEQVGAIAWRWRDYIYGL